MEKEEDKSLPVYVLGHSMGSLVATVAAEKCQESAIVAPRFKKLVLSGKRACPTALQGDIVLATYKKAYLRRVQAGTA